MRKQRSFDRKAISNWYFCCEEPYKLRSKTDWIVWVSYLESSLDRVGLQIGDFPRLPADLAAKVANEILKSLHEDVRFRHVHETSLTILWQGIVDLYGRNEGRFAVRTTTHHDKPTTNRELDRRAERMAQQFEEKTTIAIDAYKINLEKKQEKKIQNKITAEVEQKLRREFDNEIRAHKAKVLADFFEEVEYELQIALLKHEFSDIPTAEAKNGRIERSEKTKRLAEAYDEVQYQLQKVLLRYEFSDMPNPEGTTSMSTRPTTPRSR